MIPVILSGGSGQRLWPVSRKSTPKQFCQFLNEPLLELTLKRLSGFQAPLLISNINLKIPTENIINRIESPIDVVYEPLAKNTAPAVALAAKYLVDKKQADEWVCVMPADHIIKNVDLLESTLKSIESYEDDHIYLIGINPKEPKTGFGYIEIDEKIFNQPTPVTKFHEKPDLETAQKYVESGNFFWNSGIFIFKPKTLVSYFKETKSEIWKKIDQINNFSNFTKHYESIRANSFDYEVLEKFEKIKCIPLELQWSDVGSWDEFSKVIPQETSFNNELIEINCSNNYYVSTEKKAITSIGLNDIIVVDSPDSLLLCKKSESEKVKDIVKSIKNHNVLVNHNIELKPWGYFKVILDEPHQKVKKICVYPNQQLSYQSHEKRTEQWTITKGTGLITLSDQKVNLKLGDSIQIKSKEKHRIANTSDEVLEFIEVQTGSYFGEDDIIRFEDDYGRVD